MEYFKELKPKPYQEKSENDKDLEK